MIADGAMGTMLQAADLVAGRLRRARGLQRDPQRHPPGRRARASTAPTSRPAPTRWRPTRSGRTCPTSPSTTSPTGSGSWPRRARGWPARSPTRCPRPDRPRFVLGSVGPGHQAADARPRVVRPAARRLHRVRPRAARRRRRRGGRGDLPGPAAGQGGRARRAAGDGRRGPAHPDHHPGHRGDHRHDAAGHRDRRRAHRAGAAGHRPDRAELRHRPRRDERAPAHAVQARPDPAVGDAQRRACRGSARTARSTRSRPTSWPRRWPAFVREYGLRLVGGCCGTTPEHIRAVVDAVARRHARRPARRGPSRASARSTPPVPFRQDTSVLMVGERTNANGSKKFREAMLAEDWEDCVEIARDQTRDGAHLIDLCVDYVGRDGVADMAELAGRLATASTLPVMLDSTEPEVLRAGLERLGGRCDHQLGQLRGRRRPGLAVPARDGAGPRARLRGRRAVHRRGGPGPHRGVEGAGGRPADRRPDRRTTACTSRTSSSTP